jgi:uncharacterized protein (TIGR02391 family)
MGKIRGIIAGPREEKSWSFLLSNADFLHDVFPEEFSKEDLSPSGEAITDLTRRAAQFMIRMIRRRFPDDERLNSIHPRVWKAAVSLYESGYRGPAILEAYKAINARVREMTGSHGSDKDGKALMGYAFNASNPILRLNDGKTRSERDEQEGFSLIFMGAMLGVRNPKAHDLMAPIDEDRALEYLTLASLLMRRLDDAAARLCSKNGS